jgi:hypothetical protein
MSSVETNFTNNDRDWIDVHLFFDKNCYGYIDDEDADNPYLCRCEGEIRVWVLINARSTTRDSVAKAESSGDHGEVFINGPELAGKDQRELVDHIQFGTTRMGVSQASDFRTVPCSGGELKESVTISWRTKQPHWDDRLNMEGYESTEHEFNFNIEIESCGVVKKASISGKGGRRGTVKLR